MGDGIVLCGLGYGIKIICVDGNDVLVIYVVIKEVCCIVIEEKCFVFIEVMIYCLVVYFMLDDLIGYCFCEEEDKWCVKDFIVCMVKWLESKGWFDEVEN